MDERTDRATCFNKRNGAPIRIIVMRAGVHSRVYSYHSKEDEYLR